MSANVVGAEDARPSLSQRAGRVISRAGILIPFLILSLAAIGVNILIGYCGQISLGSGAFWNMVMRTQRSDFGSKRVAPKQASLQRNRSIGRMPAGMWPCTRMPRRCASRVSTGTSARSSEP